MNLQQLISNLGYKDNSPFNKKKSLLINSPNGLISMDDVSIPLYAKDNTGMTKLLLPNSGLHQFKGTSIQETPAFQTGGNVGCPKGYIWNFESHSCIPGDDSVNVFQANDIGRSEYDPINNQILLDPNSTHHTINHEKYHAISALKYGEDSIFRYAPHNQGVYDMQDESGKDDIKHGRRLAEFNQIVDNFPKEFSKTTGKIYTPDMMFMGDAMRKKIADELIYNKPGTAEYKADQFANKELNAKKQNNDVQLNFRQLGGNTNKKEFLKFQSGGGLCFDNIGNVIPCPQSINPIPKLDVKNLSLESLGIKTNNPIKNVADGTFYPKEQLQQIRKTGDPLPKYKDEKNTKILKDLLFDTNPDSFRYNEIDSNKYLVLQPLLKKSGSPDLELGYTKLGRASFNPLSNKMNVINEDDILSEIPHAQQLNKSFVGMIKNGVKDWFKNPYFNQEQYDERQYSAKGSIENEAHTLIEPKLREDYRNSKYDIHDMYQGNYKKGGIINNNTNNMTPNKTKEYSYNRNNSKKYQSGGGVDTLRHQAGKMMDFESKKGSANGTGLSNWGYNQTQLPYNQDASNWHAPQTKEQAVDLYMKEIAPKLTQFPSAMEKGEAGDFLYNTGRDPRVYMLDQYLKTQGQPGLPNRGSYNVDTKTDKWTPDLQNSLDAQWDANKAAIYKLPENDRRVLLNKGRDFYYQNINQVNGKPNPAYEATWKPRIWESVNKYQIGGVTPRLVQSVPQGYSPIPNKPNYYQNPQQNIKQNVLQASGTLASDNDWNDFLATPKGQQWKQNQTQQSQSNDIVYTQPQITPTLPINPRSYFAQEGDTYFNSNQQIGAKVYQPIRNGVDSMNSNNLNIPQQPVYYQPTNSNGQNVGDGFMIPGADLNRQSPGRVVPNDSFLNKYKTNTLGKTFKIGGYINEAGKYVHKDGITTSKPGLWSNVYMKNKKQDGGYLNKYLDGGDICYDNNGVIIPCEDSQNGMTPFDNKGNTFITGAINPQGEKVGGTGAIIQTPPINTTKNNYNPYMNAGMGLLAANGIFGALGTMHENNYQAEAARRKMSDSEFNGSYSNATNDYGVAKKGGYLKYLAEGGEFDDFDFLDEFIADGEDEDIAVKKDNTIEIEAAKLKEQQYAAITKENQELKQQAEENDNNNLAMGIVNDASYKKRMEEEDATDFSGVTDNTTNIGQSGSASGSKNGFNTYNTPEAGMNALHYQLDLYKTGRTKNNVNGNSSLYHAMSVYAPAADRNNPKQYAEFIAKNMGISPSTPISQIDTKQWASSIARMEGNKVGNNPGNIRHFKSGGEYEVSDTQLHDLIRRGIQFQMM